MKKELMNLFLFIFICFIVYILFRNFNYNTYSLEGMTNSSDTDAKTTSSVINGIAGNASAYAASIKASTIKKQDTFLISKYRSEYETIILNLDDYVNNLMLQTALTLDQSKPDEAITKLSEMNQAKTALNNIMKFVDSSH